jgi:hypothetical protein
MSTDTVECLRLQYIAACQLADGRRYYLRHYAAPEQWTGRFHTRVRYLSQRAMEADAAQMSAYLEWKSAQARSLPTE